MEFRDSVDVVPLRLEPYQIYDLESHILLAYVGETRLSSGIIKKQTSRLVSGVPSSIASLQRLRDLAYEARTALLSDQYAELARCIDEGWHCKSSLADSISSPVVDNLYNVGINAGALAGKLIGAGGGGYMLFFVSPANRRYVFHQLETAGAAVAMNINFGSSGVFAWERRANLASVPRLFGRSERLV